MEPYAGAAGGINSRRRVKECHPCGEFSTTRVTSHLYLSLSVRREEPVAGMLYFLCAQSASVPDDDESVAGMLYFFCAQPASVGDEYR